MIIEEKKMQQKKESTQTPEKLEQFNKELNKKILRMMFPVLSSIPVPWIVIIIVCFLSGLFTMLF